MTVRSLLSSFKVYFNDLLLRNHKTNLYQQMVSFDGNPYGDCEKKDNITTSVQSLEVQQWNGSKVVLRDLPEDVSLTIRTSDVPFNSYMDSFVLLVNRTAAAQFHRFNHSLEDVAVGIEFFSEDNRIEGWDLMVAHGKRPTVYNNLAMWSVNGNKTKLFLLESRFLKNKGTYYVKVQGKPNLSSKSDIFNSSYSFRISTVRCFFWMETVEIWNLDGCRVSKIPRHLRERSNSSTSDWFNSKVISKDEQPKSHEMTPFPAALLDPSIVHLV